MSIEVETVEEKVEDTTKIVPFNYGDNLVRTINENDELYWVAKDVCDILGYTKVDRALSKLDADEKDTQILSTPGGNQKMSVINESGLYSLKQLAEIPIVFSSWVVHLLAVSSSSSFSLAEKNFSTLLFASFSEINKLDSIKEEKASSSFSDVSKINLISLSASSSK